MKATVPGIQEILLTKWMIILSSLRFIAKDAGTLEPFDPFAPFMEITPCRGVGAANARVAGGVVSNGAK
jgi:hypothetical protein